MSLIADEIWSKLVQTGVQLHCWDIEAFEQSWRSKSGFYKNTMSSKRRADTREVIGDYAHRVAYDRLMSISQRDHMLISLLQVNMGVPSWFCSRLTIAPDSSVIDAVLLGLN